MNLGCRRCTTDQRDTIKCLLNPILTKELCFETIETFSHSQYSVFGTSRPNFAFYKRNQGSVIAGVVSSPECESEHT